MNESRFNVVLYSDGSKHSFSAAIYAATLLKKLPNMHLIVVQVQEESEGPIGSQYNWVFTWSGEKASRQMKQVINRASDLAIKNKYDEILAKTNKIFAEKGVNVTNEVIHSQSRIAEKTDSLLEYVYENQAELIIMGTRGPKDLDGLIHGSLAHSLLHKSVLPVLLIKKLPQKFIDSFCSDNDDFDHLTVLLYIDGSLHSFSAAVYTANFLKDFPFIQLTILQVQEGFIVENRNFDSTSTTNPKFDWMKSLRDETDQDLIKQYSKIHTRINELFSDKVHNVKQQVVYAKTSIPDIVTAIDEYATDNKFELIVMGTRGPTDLAGLMYGSLAHSLLHKSNIPVLLIKKLPQKFIDSFCSDTSF